MSSKFPLVGGSNGELSCLRRRRRKDSEIILRNPQRNFLKSLRLTELAVFLVLGGGIIFWGITKAEGQLKVIGDPTEHQRIWIGKSGQAFQISPNCQINMDRFNKSLAYSKQEDRWITEIIGFNASDRIVTCKIPPDVIIPSVLFDRAIRWQCIPYTALMTVVCLSRRVVPITYVEVTGRGALVAIVFGTLALGIILGGGMVWCFAYPKERVYRYPRRPDYNNASFGQQTFATIGRPVTPGISPSVEMTGNR